MVGLVHFSIDTASNDVAAPPINFQEGQAAGSVNNSMRELMAALARYHADLAGGLLATGAAGNLLSVGTNQVITADAFARPFEVAFEVDGTNTGPVQINVDGRGFRPLRRPDLTELGPGDLSPNIAYRVRRRLTGDQFILVSPTIVRAGRIDEFASADAVPPGYLLCDGRAVSRTSYAALFAALGTTWGVGNGTTTFNIPDKRGRAGFGADDMGGTDAGRLSAAGGIAGTLGSVGGTETVTLTEAQLAPHDHDATASNGGAVAAGETGLAGGHDHGGNTGNGGAHDHGGATGNGGSHRHNGTTENGGQHDHKGAIANNTNGSVQSTGPALAGVWYGGLAPGGADTSLAGSHNHPFETDIEPAHDHAIANQPAHQHTIPNEPAHRHATPAIPAHSHPVTVDPAGGGAPHPNMPPGVCVIFAVKT